MKELNKNDLSTLPKKYGIGRNHDKLVYDWSKCIRYKIKFIYDDIHGEIEIISYNTKKSKLKIKYLEDEFTIHTGHFLECKLGYLLNKFTIDFKVEIGTIFKDDKRNLIITDREYIADKQQRKWKKYRYHCTTCGWDQGNITEGDLLYGYGCSCCDSKITVEGINDIPTTASWMVKFFKGGCNEAKLYTKSSNAKIYPICPDCKKAKTKSMSINTIYQRKSIQCTCSDGVSYSEKFIINFLDQINVEYETQKNFRWSDKRKYDIFIPSSNCIIEIHGLQHYERGFKNVGGRTLEEEQENDRLKEKLAKENGIENYIVMDCRKSELSWIRNSIMKSELNNLIEINRVNWLKCEEFSLSNIVKIACAYKKENAELTTTEIGKIMKIHGGTISRYLKRGTDLGWCSYDPKEEQEKLRKRPRNYLNKKILVVKNGKEIGAFPSGVELAKSSEDLFKIKFTRAGISAACLGKIKNYKGYELKYIN